MLERESRLACLGCDKFRATQNAVNNGGLSFSSQSATDCVRCCDCVYFSPKNCGYKAAGLAGAHDSLY